jgi:hypothetical protein
MLCELADMTIARAAFSIIVLESLEQAWFQGQPFEARLYSSVCRSFIDMVAEVVKRTAFELVNP